MPFFEHGWHRQLQAKQPALTVYTCCLLLVFFRIGVCKYQQNSNLRPARLCTECYMLGPPVVPFYPFLGGGFPCKNRPQKKGYPKGCPYSNLSTGGPSMFTRTVNLRFLRRCDVRQFSCGLGASAGLRRWKRCRVAWKRTALNGPFRRSARCPRGSLDLPSQIQT